MLSSASKPYIDASVPALRQHGLAITTAFYRNLFTEYPDLKNLFNMGNQAQGLQQQSLAAAVFAYASNISNPEALTPVISRIAHKHVSLGILPEHYPIVGRHLLGAIKEVLGDTATQPLLDAWSEAYGLLADALISYEKTLYERSSVVPGYLTKLKVKNIKQVSKLVKSFELVTLDGAPLAEFKPGQYVSVVVDFADGTRQFRQYSLSDAPSNPYYRITVKRESFQAESPAGQVSNWLHDNLNQGDTLLVGQPSGDFTPEAQAHETIALISGGVGITPMISTLKYLAEVSPLQKVIFAHAAQSKDHHSHVEDIDEAMRVMPNLNVITFYGNIENDHVKAENEFHGFMQLKHFPEWESANSKFYLCGSVNFMKSLKEQLSEKGVPNTHIFKEVFGPDLLSELLCA
jgi:nitric oxide dioxygenase